MTHRLTRHIAAVAGVSLLSVGVVTSAPVHADVVFPEFTTEELVANDFVLYYVNAGAGVVDTAADGDHMGLFQSRTDQAFAPDDTTGAQWGYLTDAYSVPAASSNSSNVKSASVRYDAKPSATPEAEYEKRHVSYRFEIPNGTYDITVGYQMPNNWTSRTMDVYIDDSFVGAQTADGTPREYTTDSVEVSDGALDIRVASQAGRTNSYTDPAVGWIEVRQAVSFGPEELATLVRLRTLDDDQRQRYAADSLVELDEALEAATRLLEGEATPAQIEEARSAIEQAWAKRREVRTYSSFRPGEPWLDTNGRAIQAHGGQVVNSPDTPGDYYWFGEDRSHGYQPMDGVRGYRSSDLYNWEDQGVVMRSASSRAQLDEDPYFDELYADYTSIQKDIAYLDLDRDGTTYDHGRQVIFERPKVMYNSATDQWVMWIHTDGPTPSSDAQYAKATAGVAVADNAFGPYRYVDSYRLNYVPADDPDNKYPSQNGMARDMNVFVDTGAGEDGQDDGYIVYSSEENLTMYVSRLDPSFTFLAKHPDDAVKGVDFTNNWPGGQREAPAMFKYADTYYMITSGATGWDPNPADYATAETPLGPWQRHGNPATSVNGGSPANTHRSQSTNVITIDEEAGKFIYMGDRWTPQDLANAPYVWLPLSFGEGTSMSLNWEPEWTLEDLENRGRITWEADMPEYLHVGGTEALPATITVTDSGRTSEVPVTWNESALNVPGMSTITGTYDSGRGDRQITAKIPVIPRSVSYLVDAGGDGTGADYLAIREAIGKDGGGLLSEAPDQAYVAGETTWGHLGGNTDTSGSDSDSWYHSLRYVLSGADDRGLHYRFDGLPDGEYTIYVGYYDPWSQWANNRRARVLVNDVEVEASRHISGEETVGVYSGIRPEESSLALTLDPLGTGEGTDVQLSWVMISANE